MRTVRLVVAYDGSAFFGWQRQEGFRSVQQCLEEAVERLTGEEATVHGAGRTDAGVHALRQVAHFRTASVLPDPRILKALNALSPPDLAVRAACTVEEGFHARHSALGKRYVYRLHLDPIRPVLLRRVVAWIPWPVDVAAVRAAASHLVGRHDFAAFAVSSGKARASTLRTISRIRLRRAGPRLDLFFQGDGFLHNMVRSMVGSLLEVGRGRRDPVWIQSVLRSRDRRRAGPTAPPQGLFLLRVLYPPGPVGAPGAPAGG